jgi:membrane protease YdiL (CAAX protease family)
MKVSAKQGADRLAMLVFIIFIPVVGTLIFSIPFLLLNVPRTGIGAVLETIFTMGPSFVLIPLLALRDHIRLSLGSFGVMDMQVTDWVLSFAIFIIPFIWNYLIRENTFYVGKIMTQSLQIFVVAACEEFWSRGVIYDLLSRICKKEILVIILTTMIFTFVIHAHRSVLENFLYRLPGALSMTLIFWKTKKLPYAVALHFAYDMILII